MSPSRLDPPRVAILPTAAAGNNNSVLIPKAQMRVAKGKMSFTTPRCRKGVPSGQQPSAKIAVTTARLHLGSRSLLRPARASQMTTIRTSCWGMRRICGVTPTQAPQVKMMATSRTAGTIHFRMGASGDEVQAGETSGPTLLLFRAQPRRIATATRSEQRGLVCQRKRMRL
jgi:hypothetical protein